MRSIRVLLILLLATTLAGIGAPRMMAQTASTGALTGTVTDASGGVIAGAKVTVTNLSTGQARTVTTNSSAADSLAEGLEEMPTIHRLDVGELPAANADVDQSHRVVSFDGRASDAEREALARRRSIAALHRHRTAGSGDEVPLDKCPIIAKSLALVGGDTRADLTTVVGTQLRSV